MEGRKEELGGWRGTIDWSGVSDEGKEIDGQLKVALSVGMCVQQHSVPRFDEDRIRRVGMRMRSETGYWGASRWRIWRAMQSVWARMEVMSCLEDLRSKRESRRNGHEVTNINKRVRFDSQLLVLDPNLDVIELRIPPSGTSYNRAVGWIYPPSKRRYC